MSILIKDIHDILNNLPDIYKLPNLNDQKNNLLNDKNNNLLNIYYK